MEMTAKNIYRLVRVKAYNYVKFHINIGVDINIIDDKGITAFHIAVSENNISVMQWLASHGANINQCDNNGINPLHYATIYGIREAMEWLVNHGANINQATSNGSTALHLAVIHRRIEAVELLAAHGANFNQQDENGATALQIAEQREDGEILALLNVYIASRKKVKFIEGPSKEDKNATDNDDDDHDEDDYPSSDYNGKSKDISSSMRAEVEGTGKSNTKVDNKSNSESRKSEITKAANDDVSNLGDGDSFVEFDIIIKHEQALKTLPEMSIKLQEDLKTNVVEAKVEINFVQTDGIAFGYSAFLALIAVVGLYGYTYDNLESYTTALSRISSSSSISLSGILEEMPNITYMIY